MSGNGVTPVKSPANLSKKCSVEDIFERESQHGFWKLTPELIVGSFITFEYYSIVPQGICKVNPTLH